MVLLFIFPFLGPQVVFGFFPPFFLNSNKKSINMFTTPINLFMTIELNWVNFSFNIIIFIVVGWSIIYFVYFPSNESQTLNCVFIFFGNFPYGFYIFTLIIDLFDFNI